MKVLNYTGLQNLWTNIKNYITVHTPTKTSDLINDSNFVDTSNPAVSSGITSAKVTDYDTHIADTDIHVTTADKTKWNNNVTQSFVFRYSSTALVASSTNSNTLLDNTDNLKVGDKVIDSSGVIYSVTAIDTANSTFTIGTSLIDLAQDSDVLHKSGDEAIGGIKNFTDYTYIRALNFTNEVASPSSSGSAVMPIVTTVTYGDSSPSQSARLNFRVTADGIKSLYPHENNQYALGLQSRKWSEVRAIQYYYGSSDVEFSTKFVTTDTAQTVSGSKTYNDLQIIGYGTQYKGARNAYILPEFSAGYSGLCITTLSFAQTLKIGNFVLDANNNPSLDTTKAYIQCATGENNGVNACVLEPRNSTSSSLGTSLNKWIKFNGLEPSSLSLPSDNLNDVIDISSYLTYLDGHANTYIAPANGWISITMSNSSGVQAYISGLWGHQVVRPSAGTIRFLMPILKDKTTNILIFGGAISNARFIPCQGNV